MGWASGSRLLEEVVNSIIENVDDEEARKNIYRTLIESFEDFDCDTICEIVDDIEDECFREVYYEIHPDHDIDNYDYSD